MTPSLRSQSAKDVKFPVIVTADIDTQILRELLVNPPLALVAKQDLSKFITDTNDAKLDSYQSPFVHEDFLEAYEALYTFLDTYPSKAGVSHRVFVVLDNNTASDGKTCQIATDGRDIEDITQPQFALRCDLSSVAQALAAVEQASTEPPVAIRHLRNEAAVVGGIWNRERVEEFKARPRRIDPAQFPIHKDWDLGSGRIGPDTDIPYYPVFQTAELRLETVNEFLEQTYDQDWGDEDGDSTRPAVAFVTSTDAPPFHSGKAGNRLDSLPQVPRVLFGASAMECDVIARSRFPEDGSDMDYNMFIVLDELSEKDKTVIIAASNEQDGDLLLARCAFKSALLSLVATSDTNLTVDSQSNSAMVEGDGVMRN